MSVPRDLLLGFLTLLAGLLFGQLLAHALELPVPGAVVGMTALALLLAVLRRRVEAIEGAADSILRHMPLLFVPAGVGVMQFGSTLRGAWLPLLVTLLFGTLLSIAVTALTLRACLALQARRSTQRTGGGEP